MGRGRLASEGELPKFRELTRVLPTGGESRTGLALAASLVPVGVVRGQFVSPLAGFLPAVDCRKRFAALLVHLVGDGLPVCGILAAPVLACVSAGTCVVYVVAGMVPDLPRVYAPYQFTELVTVCWHAPALAISDHGVVFLRSACGPWPALTGATLVNFCQVLLHASRAAHVGATSQRVSVLQQFLVVSIAESLGANAPMTVAALGTGVTSTAWLTGLRRTDLRPGLRGVRRPSALMSLNEPSWFPTDVTVSPARLLRDWCRITV